MTSLSSAHGGVVLGLLPIATAVAAVFFAGERPSPFFWLMSVLGAALVVAFSLRDGGVVPAPADLILFARVAICGTGYALAGTLSRRMPGWEVISWAVVLALPVMGPLTFVLWPNDLAQVPLPSWMGLAYAAIVSQYLGFWLWNTALAHGGVARIGQLQLLQPFATLAIAALHPWRERSICAFSSLPWPSSTVVAIGVRARVGPRANPAVTPLAGATEGS